MAAAMTTGVKKRKTLTCIKLLAVVKVRVLRVR